MVWNVPHLNTAVGEAGNGIPKGELLVPVHHYLHQFLVHLQQSLHQRHNPFVEGFPRQKAQERLAVGIKTTAKGQPLQPPPQLPRGIHVSGNPFDVQNIIGTDRDTKSPSSSSSACGIHVSGNPFDVQNIIGTDRDTKSPSSSSSACCIHVLGNPFDVQNIIGTDRDTKSPSSSSSACGIHVSGNPFDVQNIIGTDRDTESPSSSSSAFVLNKVDIIGDIIGGDTCVPCLWGQGLKWLPPERMGGSDDTAKCTWELTANENEERTAKRHKRPCGFAGCSTTVWKGGMCRKHHPDGHKTCGFTGCSTTAWSGGKCRKHHPDGYKTCGFGGCSTTVWKGGKCWKHHPDGYKTCGFGGCSTTVWKGGKCRKHQPDAVKAKARAKAKVRSTTLTQQDDPNYWSGLSITNTSQYYQDQMELPRQSIQQVTSFSNQHHQPVNWNRVKMSKQTNQELEKQLEECTVSMCIDNDPNSSTCTAVRKLFEQIFRQSEKNSYYVHSLFDQFTPTGTPLNFLSLTSRSISFLG